jgi:hypothetical protein
MEPDSWGEHWIYNSVYVEGTIATLEAITKYIYHIEEAFGLNNVMILELLNEPWQMIDMGL